jgi:hypothetical protein
MRNRPNSKETSSGMADTRGEWRRAKGFEMQTGCAIPRPLQGLSGVFILSVFHPIAAQFIRFPLKEC